MQTSFEHTINSFSPNLVPPCALQSTQEATLFKIWPSMSLSSRTESFHFIPESAFLSTIISSRTNLISVSELPNNFNVLSWLWSWLLSFSILPKYLSLIALLLNLKDKITRRSYLTMNINEKEVSLEKKWRRTVERRKVS